MINVLISGALGKMGKKVYEALSKQSNIKAICGVDIKAVESDTFPIYDNFSSVKEKIDVVIDFSSPLALNGILDYIVKNHIPAVLCATGYSEEQVKEVLNASKKTAIFRSANMSLGVNALISAVKVVSKALYGFDIEIVEAHHNQKKDAPSGTAIMLLDAIKSVYPEKHEVYGRNGIVGARDKNEIGIHSLRGGNIVGNHEVMFAGENETVTLTHNASDRAVFAEGAVKAAIFISDKKTGLFDMNDLISCAINA